MRAQNFTPKTRAKSPAGPESLPWVPQPQHRGRGKRGGGQDCKQPGQTGPCVPRLPREGDVAPCFRLPREQRLAACRVILSTDRENEDLGFNERASVGSLCFHVENTSLPNKDRGRRWASGEMKPTEPWHEGRATGPTAVRSTTFLHSLLHQALALSQYYSIQPRKMKSSYRRDYDLN